MSSPFYNDEEDPFMDASYSRSRTLAKQRELALNRRNEVLGGQNLARSTEGLNVSTSHKTPSITQFSAPTSVESESKHRFFKDEDELETLKDTINVSSSLSPSRSAFDEFDENNEEDEEDYTFSSPSYTRQKGRSRKDKEEYKQASLVSYDRYGQEELLGGYSQQIISNQLQRREEEEEEEERKRSRRERPSKVRKKEKNEKKKKKKKTASSPERKEETSKRKYRKEAKRLRLDELKDSDDEDQDEDEKERKEEFEYDDESAIEQLDMQDLDEDLDDDDDIYYGSKEGEYKTSHSSSLSSPHPSLDFTNMKDLVTRPLPRRAGLLQCYILRRRDTSSSKMFPVYELYTQEGDLFLLTAKRRKGNKTSNYLISLTKGDLDRHSPSYLGKVRSNFMGTEYHIYDNGVREEDLDVNDRRSHVRCELGVVTYASNLLRPKAPRRMNVGIPSTVSLSGEEGEGKMVIERWEEKEENQTLLSALKGGVWKDLGSQKSNHGPLSEFVNKHPRWNPSVGAYVLNFNGRVTMASVKNFQLVDPQEEDGSVCLQFGRIGEDEFTMDFSYPFSPLQAFAICLSSFDSKIACD